MQEGRADLCCGHPNASVSKKTVLIPGTLIWDGRAGETVDSSTESPPINIVNSRGRLRKA